MDKIRQHVNDMRLPKHIRKSALESIGLKVYTFWKIEEGYISAPADTHIHIAYIVDGYGYYEDTKIKTGDVVSFGLNIEPIRFKAHKMSMFILDIDFSLFYSITGLSPSDYHHSIINDHTNHFYRLGQILFRHPVKYWVGITELYILRVFQKYGFPKSNSLERVVLAANKIAEECDFSSIAEDMKISYRQLQRDFQSMLGLSLKEYRSIIRFRAAAYSLKNESIINVVNDAGYYDQSHMTKEFKKKSGLTPKEASMQPMYYVDLCHLG